MYECLSRREKRIFLAIPSSLIWLPNLFLVGNEKYLESGLKKKYPFHFYSIIYFFFKVAIHFHMIWPLYILNWNSMIQLSDLFFCSAFSYRYLYYTVGWKWKRNCCFEEKQRELFHFMALFLIIFLTHCQKRWVASST